MLESEASAVRPMSPSDEMILRHLRDGLRPAEIAVRMALPVGEIHDRIAGLTRPPGTQVGVEPVPVAPAAAAAAAVGLPVGSRVPAAILGVVAAVFLFFLAVFVATSGGGERTPVAGGGEVAIPILITPVPPLQVDGVTFQRARLGAPLALEPGLGLLVWEQCRAGCAPTLSWYIGDAGGPRTVPVALPEGLRDIAPRVSRDGSDLIVSGRRESGWLVFRSQDAGATWVELGGAPDWPNVAFAGPEHVAIVAARPDGAAGIVILPGGQELAFDANRPPALTPWQVDFQIRKEKEILPQGLSGSANADGTRVLAAVRAPNRQGGNLVALYDGRGTMLTGWSHSPALPWGTLVGERAYVTGAVDPDGEFILQDEDEGPYPGEVRFVPMVFDTVTGTVHRLEVMAAEGRDVFVFTAGPPPASLRAPADATPAGEQ